MGEMMLLLRRDSSQAPTSTLTSRLTWIKISKPASFHFLMVRSQTPYRCASALIFTNCRSLFSLLIICCNFLFAPLRAVQHQPGVAVLNRHEDLAALHATLYDPQGEPIVDRPDPHSKVTGNAGLISSQANR